MPPRQPPPSLPSDPIIAAFVALVADAPVIGFIKDVDGRYVYANRHLLATAFQRIGSDWRGKADIDIWPPDVAAVVDSSDKATLRGSSLQVFTQAMPVRGETHTFLIMKLPLVLADGRVYLGGIGVDQTAGMQMGAERNLLASVVEQVGESVMIADLESRITYVNPAFERATGYTRDEVLGRNARILNSGVQPRSFYAAMWTALTSGGLWAADFINRQKDGSLFTEQAIISPIRDASAAITGYVAVKRDVTKERALEQRSARLARERVLIAETLRGLRTGDTPEDTAQAICRQVLGLSGVAAAQLFVFEVDGRAVTIGFAITGQPDPPLQRLPSVPSRDLRSRAAQGPWIQSWVARPGDPYYEELKGLGAHLVASAPVRANDDLIGLLVIDALESTDEATFAESLAALVEFADLAAALIARDVADRTEARPGKGTDPRDHRSAGVRTGLPTDHRSPERRHRRLRSVDALRRGCQPRAPVRRGRRHRPRTGPRDRHPEGRLGGRRGPAQICVAQPQRVAGAHHRARSVALPVTGHKAARCARGHRACGDRRLQGLPRRLRGSRAEQDAGRG